jgi:hypothetical protein
VTGAPDGQRRRFYSSTIANVIAYYHWPGVWLGEPPTRQATAPLGGENYALDQLSDAVFSGGVAGLRVRALREGRFLFDFSAWPEYLAPWDNDLAFDEQTEVAVRRAELINSHVLCLHIALSRQQRFALQKPVVSPLDFISYESLETNASHGWIDTRLSPLLMAGSIASYNQLSPTVFDWRLSNRTVIALETVEESLRILEQVISHPNLPMLAIGDLYLRSTAFYESHDYNLALVAAWAVIETLLQRLWSSYLDANRTRVIDGADTPFINSERRTRLLSGRDYTASVVSETLSLVGSLPQSSYLELDKVRRDRNRFLHELTAISRPAADRALSVAEQMLVDVSGLDLTVPRLSRLGG